MHRLADGIWILRLPLPYPMTPVVNTFLFAEPDGYALVDCGSALPPGWDALEHALGLVGVEPDQLSLLVTTHPHSDHAGLAATVVDRTGCAYARFEGPQAQMERMRDLWVPIEERRRLAREHGVPEDVLEVWIASHVADDGRHEVVQPDRLLREHDVIPSRIGDWVVHSAVGHSASQLMLFNPGRGWLISADLVLRTQVPFFEWGHMDDPFAQHLDSLRRARALRPTLLLPGHGRPVQHVDEQIAFAIKAAEDERDRIRDLIAAGPVTLYELSRRFVTDHADLDQRQAALSIVRSVVDHLERRGEVSVPDDGAVRRVRLAR